MLKKSLTNGITSVFAVALLMAGHVLAADLSVTPEAAMAGSNYGLQVDFDGSDLSACYVEDQSPNSETTMRVFFRLKNSPSFSMAMRDGHDIYRATGLGKEAFVLKYRMFNVMGGTNYVQLHAKRDNGTWTRPLLGMNATQAGWKISWQAASSPGANDGFIRLSVRQADGTFRCLGEVTGIDNDTFVVNNQRLGAMGGITAGTTGALYFDTFESYRTIDEVSPTCDNSYAD